MGQLEFSFPFDLPNISSKNKIFWIDSLKLCASILVMCSHFYNAFFYIDAADAMSVSLKSFINLTGGIVKGDLWVCVFCLFSGLFCSKKKINDIRTLLTECFLRYIRLCVPLFFAGIFIYIMSSFGLFLNSQSNDILGNNLYLNLFYQKKIDIVLFLKGVFLFGYELNSPFWMMKWLLLGNCLVFLCDFFCNCINKAFWKSRFLFLSIILCVLTNKLYTGSCLVGALLFPMTVEDTFDKSKRVTVKVVSSTILVLVFANCLDGLLFAFANKLTLDYETIKDFILAPAIFCLIGSSNFLKRIFALKPLIALSQYSFTVFLIHWPILCSLSLFMFKILLPIYTYDFTFTATLFTTIVSVLVLSILYEKTIGRVSANTIQRIREIVK